MMTFTLKRTLSSILLVLSCAVPAATKAARATAWALVLLAVFLTLGPPRYRPETGLNRAFEHLLAFALIGLALGLAYPRRRMVIVSLGIVGAALIEILQQWVPGRHAYVSDFAVNGLGICVGLFLSVLLDILNRRLNGDMTHK